MRARYHLITEAAMTPSLARVWEVLTGDDWPVWWRWARRVEELEAPGEDGVGGAYLHEVATPLAYRLTYRTTVVGVEYPSFVHVRSTGDLHGDGRLQLATTNGGTILTFAWRVETSRRWMNVVAPIARRLFIWSHDRLMTDLVSGLAGAAGGSLRWVSHREVHPADRASFVNLARSHDGVGHGAPWRERSGPGL